MTNDQETDISRETTSSPGFATGLFIGGIVGALAALAFAPRSGVDLRRQVAGAARNLGTAASERYQEASTGVTKAVGHLSTDARAARDEVADAVARGAHDVARFATSMKG